MKKTIVPLILLSLITGNAKSQKDILEQNRLKREQLHKDNEKKKEKIRNKFQSYLKLINAGGSSNIKLPVNAKYVKSLKHHTKGFKSRKHTKPIYAYAKISYNLKFSPDLNSQTTGIHIRKNQKVKVLFQMRSRISTKKWCMILAKDEGFMPCELLRNHKNDLKEINNKLPKYKYYVKVSSGLNMRAEPSTKGKKITTIPNEAKVIVHKFGKTNFTYSGKTGPWAYITYRGKKGWVFSPFLTKKKTKNTNNNNVISSGGFVMPLRGTVTSKYGWRRGGKEFHGAIDVACKRGTPIKAAKDGKIVRSKWTGAYGRLTVIKHSNKLYSFYAHQKKWRLKKGKTVKAGDIIGYVGTSGRSSGPHLHFELRTGKMWGKKINPTKVFKYKPSF